MKETYKVGAGRYTKYRTSVDGESFIIRISSNELNKVVDAFMMTENCDLYYWLFSENREKTERNEKLVREAIKRITEDMERWKEEVEEAYYASDTMNLVSEYIL